MQCTEGGWYASNFMAGKRTVGRTKQFCLRAQPVRARRVEGKSNLSRNGMVTQIFRHGQGMLLLLKLMLLMLRPRIVPAHSAEIAQPPLRGIGPQHQALVQTIRGHHPGEAVQIPQEDDHPTTDPAQLDQNIVGMLRQMLLLLLIRLLTMLLTLTTLPAVRAVEHGRRRRRRRRRWVGRWHVVDAPPFQQVSLLNGLRLLWCIIVAIIIVIPSTIAIRIGYHHLVILVINVQPQRNVQRMPKSLQIGSAST